MSKKTTVRELTDEDWLARRHDVVREFTPGTPINETDLFAGRVNTVLQLQDTAVEQGRHAAIYGERGVGKTSIANIFHRPLNSSTHRVEAIRVNADSADNFQTLWDKVGKRLAAFPDTWKNTDFQDSPSGPDDVLLMLTGANSNVIPIIIIDEFDRIEDEECKILMTDTIKMLSDYSTNCTLVLVGVAESVSDLVRGHESISRALVQVPMRRMATGELADIVTQRLNRLGMTIHEDALWRITFFSAGLPFYTHSLGKHSALRAVMARRSRIIEADVYDAIQDCVGDVDYTVRESYVRATERIYRKDNLYPQVLAAAALAEPDSLGKFTQAAVEKPLSAIMGSEYKAPSFAFHLNELCEDERGRVLKKTGERRTFRYHFRDSLIQPYIVMESLRKGIITPEILERFSIQRQTRLDV